VDYRVRMDLLKQLETMNVAQVMDRMDEGAPKLWLIHRALALRNQHPEWFSAQAEYVPVAVDGSYAEQIIAYRRGEAVLSVVPRWTHANAGWGDTSLILPAGTWRNQLTDEVFKGGKTLISDLLALFPVALLTRET
jgi:(1->4)-alpha-D-glucan 1-alpha-D-glucosylmutase